MQTIPKMTTQIILIPPAKMKKAPGRLSIVWRKNINELGTQQGGHISGGSQKSPNTMKVYINE